MYKPIKSSKELLELLQLLDLEEEKSKSITNSSTKTTSAGENPSVGLVEKLRGITRTAQQQKTQQVKNPGFVGKLRKTTEDQRTEDQINWIVVSMCRDIEFLKHALKTFTEQPSTPFRSATLICSGAKKSDNTPISLYYNSGGKYGFTVDPEKCKLLFASKVDCYSGQDKPHLSSDGRVVLQEKHGTILEEGGNCYNTIKTTKVQKHGIKSVEDIPREGRCERFYTDISRWNYKAKTWSELSSFNTVVANVLYRKRKVPIQDYNELLIAQKDKLNPINGIIIPVNKIKALTAKDIKDLLAIFQNNADFKLFIYDLKLEQHVIREVSNQAAIKLLSENQLCNLDASSLSPFFQSPQLLEESSSFISEKNESLEGFLQKKLINMLERFNLANSGLQKYIFEELYKEFAEKNKDIIFEKMLQNDQLYSKVLETIFEDCIEKREYEDYDTGFYDKNFLKEYMLLEKLEKHKVLLHFLVQNDSENFKKKLHTILQQYTPLHNASSSGKQFTIDDIIQKIFNEVAPNLAASTRNSYK